LILRVEDPELDFRGEGRWGVGAEIILQQNGSRQRRDLDEDEDVVDGVTPGSQEGDPEPAYSSPDGFARAQSYYERLILQYPWVRRNPHANNSLAFYPAMFGLMIYDAQQHGPPHSDTAGRQAASTPESRGTPSPQPPCEAGRNGEVQQGGELQKAHAIAARMDVVMAAPPYSDDARLRRLRDMVSSWCQDLEDESQSPI
jgi:hypothetical protein